MPKPALLAPALSVLLVVGGLAVLPAACAVGYPTLPVSDGGRFLSNLSAPTLAPGASGTLSFTVSNPLAGALSDVVLTLQVYGFNAFPGNATGPLPSAGASLFSGVGSNGSAQVLSIGTIGPGGSYSAPGNTSVAVSAGSSAPSGTYAIRTSLAFTIGGVGYRLGVPRVLLRLPVGERDDAAEQRLDPQPEPARGLRRDPGDRPPGRDQLDRPVALRRSRGLVDPRRGRRLRRVAPDLSVELGGPHPPAPPKGPNGLGEEPQERRGLTEEPAGDPRREVDVAERHDRLGVLHGVERPDDLFEIGVGQLDEDPPQVERLLELVAELRPPGNLVAPQGALVELVLR